METILGIDLGTTTSEMAYIKNGRAEIIEDRLGTRIIPSVVSFLKDEEPLVGKFAYNKILSNPERTVQEIKRYMGEDIKVKIEDDELYPHEISAIILKYLKDDAEAKLGKKIDEAVITVPANFTNQQRKATKEAGRLAGLKVERIINEPTAAAMAYGIDKQDEDSNILVYDLGGGTFDVSVLELYKGVLDVKASRGNNKLGGKDFDEKIENYILDVFKKEYGVDLYEIDSIDNNKISTKLRIKEAARTAKEDLSVQNVVEINIPFIAILNGKALNINMELTREKFDELTVDLVQDTKKTVKEAMDAAGMKYEDIDTVLMVGGSSRIAAVQKLVEELFPGKIKRDINPDEAVAMGAAIQAGIKSEQLNGKNSLIVTDKCNYNLGTSIAEKVDGQYVSDIFDCIIPVDSCIPCSKTKYYTCVDNQEIVQVDIYEGYNEKASLNEKISEIELNGIPKNSAGKEAIEITFTYDLNGTLEVTAVIVSNGKKANKRIVDERLEIKSSGNLNKYITPMPINFEDDSNMEHDIDGKFDIENYGEEDLQQESIPLNELEDWKESSIAPKVKRTIELVEYELEKQHGSVKEEIILLLNRLKKATIDEDEDLAIEIEDELTEILYDL